MLIQPLLQILCVSVLMSPVEKYYATPGDKLSIALQLGVSEKCFFVFYHCCIFNG